LAAFSSRRLRKYLASGLLCAEVRQDLVRTILCPLAQAAPELIAEAVDGLVADVIALLDEENVSRDERHVMLSADLRYVGQSHELTVRSPRGPEQPASMALSRRFTERHRGLYGYDLPKRGVELVNLRVSAVGGMPSSHGPERAGNTASSRSRSANAWCATAAEQRRGLAGLPVSTH